MSTSQQNDAGAPPRKSLSSLPSSLIVVLCCAGFALYFVGLGSYPLLDPDEPVYGQVAREMAGGAGWLSPHLNGALWFDKPPLFYWLLALSVSIFGPTEFACRLPSALAALGLIGLVYTLAQRDFGTRAARLAALVMATCLQQIVLARAAVTDMTLAFFLTLALLCYRRWLDESLRLSAEASAEASSARARLSWALGCGAATGLAMLTKGPVAPLLLSVTFVLHLWWLRRLRLLGASAGGAVLMVLLVGLPWYVLMFALHGQEFVQGFLVANNITRFLKAEHAEQTGHWYSILLNFPVLLGFFFPWSAFLPQALALGWREHGPTAAQASSAEASSAPGNAVIGARLAMVWLGVVFVFFSLSKTQLVTYIFPLYPAASLLVGVLWSRAADDGRARRGVRAGAWAALLCSVGLAVGLAATAQRKFPQAQGALLGAGAILLLACLGALWLLRSNSFNSSSSPGSSPGSNPSPSPGSSSIEAKRLAAGASSAAAWALGGGMAALALWLVLAVVPLAAPGLSTRGLIAAMPAQPAEVASFGARLPSLLFYLRLRPQNRYAGSLEGEEARRALRKSTPLFVVCRQAEAAQIMVPGAREWAREGRLAVVANAAALALRYK